MSRFHFSGIHHTAFATSDMDKTVRYWRDLLGCKIVFGLVEKHQKQYAFQIAKHMMVFFFEWEGVEPLNPKRHGEPVKGPFAFDHLSIHLDEQSDLFRLQDQLACSEQPVSDVIDHGFIHSIYTFDPNGVPLEFSWMVPTVDLENNPVFIADTMTDFKPPGRCPVFENWPECEEDSEDERVVLTGKEKPYF
ncbi:VOC family protein [bacterium]|nr:VOC family protein [bacterium]